MQFIKAPDFYRRYHLWKKGSSTHMKPVEAVSAYGRKPISKKSNKDVIVIDGFQVNKAPIEASPNSSKTSSSRGSAKCDESDREGIRVVIELKRDAMSEIVLNNLYKSTNMKHVRDYHALDVQPGATSLPYWRCWATSSTTVKRSSSAVRFSTRKPKPAPTFWKV